MRVRTYQIFVALMLSGCSVQTNPLSLTYIDQSASFPSSNKDDDSEVVTKKTQIKEPVETVKHEQKKRTSCSVFYLPKIKSSPILTDEDLLGIAKSDSKALNKALLDHIEDLNKYIEDIKRKYEEAARRQRATCVVE